jgi:hypothetical protein
MTTIVAGSLPLDMTTPGYFFANDAASVLSFSSSLIVVGAPDGTTEYYSGSFAFTYVPSAGGYELSGGVLTGLADYAPLGLVWSASGFAVSYDTYFGFAARNDANGLRQYILDQS